MDKTQTLLLVFAGLSVLASGTAGLFNLSDKARWFMTSVILALMLFSAAIWGRP